MSIYDKPQNEVISFIHLYDQTFAYFPKYARNWIVFPQDFVPDTKKKYSCQLQWTYFGHFVYNGKNYNVARAYSIDHANILDILENKTERSRQVWKGEKPKKQPTAFELALEKAALKKIQKEK